MGLPHSYLEQQTEVNKPLLEVNWIGFFNHFAQSIPVGVFTVTVFKRKRGEDWA